MTCIGLRTRVSIIKELNQNDMCLSKKMSKTPKKSQNLLKIKF